MDSLRGNLLIASPHLSDPNFRKTVVFLIEHNDEGALGVVVNRPSTMSLAGFWEELGNEPIFSEQVVYFGGPVEGHVLCLHTCSAAIESEVTQGLYLATHPNLIHQAIDNEADHFCRVFWGYAGWGEGQLESELKVGGWLVLAASRELLFPPELDTLWKKAVSLAGEKLLRESLDIRKFPTDPELN